jgi:hypothetical protein
LIPETVAFLLPSVGVDLRQNPHRLLLGEKWRFEPKTHSIRSTIIRLL